MADIRVAVKEEMALAVEKVENVGKEIKKVQENISEDAQNTRWSNLFKTELATSKEELVAAVAKAPAEKVSPTLVAEVVQQTAQATIDQTMAMFFFGCR